MKIRFKIKGLTPKRIEKIQRPLTVTLVAIIFFAGALCSLAATIILLAPNFLIPTFLSLVIGYGLWHLKKWSFYASLIILGLWFVFGVMLLTSILKLGKTIPGTYPPQIIDLSYFFAGIFVSIISGSLFYFLFLKQGKFKF